MEYDPAEIIAITETIQYQTQTDKSRARAAEPTKNVDEFLIEFYGSNRGGNNDVYGKWLSNCFYAKISIDGKDYLSSEHYYQMSKFDIDPTDPVVIEWCRSRRIDPKQQVVTNANVRRHMATLTSVQVAKYGQSYRDSPIRGDWERVKDSIMFKALVAKYTQNADFRAALLQTGNAVLVERAPTDSYWAINNKGLGRNMLGVQLMLVRSLLEN